MQYENYINLKSLVFSLKEVGDDHSKSDVFRIILQFAEHMSDKDFDKVIFAYKGTKKFYIDGQYFKQLGNEYSYQNPLYTMRTFPSELFEMDGTRAYFSFGSIFSGIEDFNDFSDEWYLDDLIEEQLGY